MTRTPARLPGALLAGALLLTGCADAGGSAHSGPMADHGDSSAAAPGDARGTFDDADVVFVRDMIPHHRQAVEMAQLAQGRAEDPRVLDLAGRIEAAQGPEIETLSGWLDRWGADAGHLDGGMDHGSGMMAEGDMRLLATASGAAFDRLFLEQMVVHHAGAVEMAETEIAHGRNADALALAEAVRDGQGTEIAEMRRLLDELGG